MVPSEGIKSQHQLYPKEEKPFVVNVLNVLKPAAGEKTLLNLDEVETILHELGHGLHTLFSKVKYASHTGTHTPRDFVEVPSTFMENFLYEREFLDMVGKHFVSGEKIPNDLIEKIVKARNNLAGTGLFRQVNYSLLDMYWHGTNGVNIQDIKKLEDEVFYRNAYDIENNNSLVSTNFSHIFEGGYAAGYYSYKWSDAIQANILNKFKEAGMFNQENAKRYRELLLSKGGSIDHLENLMLYLEKELDPDALLKLYNLK
ncbi:MAG: hypothetical protein JNM93_00545 [Bacteriovoracaceae bacterium]|nr:hypothetical protein [Bacteriovoracaceae bacterium]